MIVSRTLRRAAAAGAATIVVASLATSALPVAADETFVNGSGRADAKILRMGPSAGRLSLAPTIGLSLADYVGTLGRGESRTADFAALDGSVPEDFKAEMPTVRAESTDEDAGTAKTASFAGTPPESPIKAGGSSQSAMATKDPKGTSSYTLGAYGVPGVFEVGSSTADASAAVVGKKTREAVGVSRVSSIKLGGGIVTLNGLTWEAIQRTGEGAVTSADFRVDSVTFLGGTTGGLVPVPLPPRTVPVPNGGADFEAVLPQINAALKPTGLIVAAPSKSTDGGLARVGPLAIQIADSDIGRSALGPILGAAQPLRDPITGALIEGSGGELSTAVLLADVALGIFSGAGRFDIEFGGASAFTEGTVYDSPFGAFDFGSFTLPEASNESFALSDPGSTGTGADLGTSTFDTTSNGTVAGSAVGAAGARTTAAPGASASGGGDNQTAIPVASARTLTGKKGGAAALIGLTGLLAALGMASLDYRRIRSNRRTIVVS